ncbi:MAG: class I SAM-dependent methyltransferase, partial [Phycisphaerae bacterium]
AFHPWGRHMPPSNTVVTNPDMASRGFLAGPVEALRYDNDSLDPLETAGIITGWIPTGARVLDVGCGTGALSCLFRDHRQARIVGIEPNEIRAENARSRGLEVYTGVLESGLRGQLGDFDIAVFADVLEHVADPFELLSRAADFLKPGGQVLISVPNVAHWTVRLNLLRGRFNYAGHGIMDATHLRWFTSKTICGLCQSVGLAVEEWTVSAGLWLPEYRYNKPWKWFRTERVNWMVLRARTRWPSLFGCQLLVRARKSDTAAPAAPQPGVW